jgi:hypothetical protein
MSPDIRLPIGWQMNAMLPAAKRIKLGAQTVGLIMATKVDRDRGLRDHPV